jgi:glycosyltransferase involved in cell wall biosynthesis
LEPLKTLVRELGLADCVHFPGRADRQQVAAYMTGCEFFVISSPAEPFGIVILEAIAAGAAVIAINNAGPAEIITQGVDGLLVDRSEPELLAAAMCKLLSDSDLRRRLSAAGRQRAADFSWPKIAKQYVAAYGDAASNE